MYACACMHLHLRLSKCVYVNTGLVRAVIATRSATLSCKPISAQLYSLNVYYSIYFVYLYAHSQSYFFKMKICVSHAVLMPRCQDVYVLTCPYPRPVCTMFRRACCMLTRAASQEAANPPQAQVAASLGQQPPAALASWRAL
jgi:hypothetical protein